MGYLRATATRSRRESCRSSRDRSTPPCTGSSVEAGSRPSGRPSDNNRNAKYYELTRAGRKQLETETAAWRTLSLTIGQILDIA